MAVMPHSVDAPPGSAGAAVPARAGSGPQRVDVVAVTRSDDLLEQIGHALDGESAIRPVDSLEAAAEQFVASRAHLVLLDARDYVEIGPAVERLLSYADACVVVVFAPAEQTTEIASSIKGSAAFAVLPIPVETGQTSAVLDGARDEALARLAIVAPQVPDPGAAARVVPPLIQIEPRPVPPGLQTVDDDLLSNRSDPIVTLDGTRRRPPPALLVGAAVFLLLAVTLGWYLASRPGSASSVSPPPAPTEANAEAGAPVPAAASASSPTVQGSVDELLDRARAAFRERRYTDPASDNALTYYRSVLAQDPANEEAAEGVARIATVLDERLQSALSERRTEDAVAILGHLRLAKPGDAGLAGLEIELVESQVAAAVENGAFERANQLLRSATAAHALPADRAEHWRGEISRRQGDARVRQLAQLVNTRIDEGRLVEPGDDSAKFYLAQLRTASQDPARRAAATRRLGQAYLQQAQAAVAQGQRADAERWLAEARALGVSAGSIAAVEAESGLATVPGSERLTRPGQTGIGEVQPPDPRADSARQNREPLLPADPSGAAAARSAASVTPPQVRTAELKRTRYVAPVYPRQALEDNVRGEVRVRITVDTDGKVKDTEILQSTPTGVFDNAALAAVRRWRFKPAEVDGRPVEASMIQSLLFQPGDGT